MVTLETERIPNNAQPRRLCTTVDRVRVGVYDFAALARMGSTGARTEDAYDFLTDSGAVVVWQSAPVPPATVPAPGLGAAIRALTAEPRGVAQLVTVLNRQLCNASSRGAGALWCSRLDLSADSLTYTDADHRGAVLLRHPAGVRDLAFDESTNVGEYAWATYEEDRVRIHPGDVLLLHTASLERARNQDGDPFGRTRMIAMLEQHLDDSAPQLLDRIVECWQGFSAFADEHVAIVVMKRTR